MPNHANQPSHVAPASARPAVGTLRPGNRRSVGTAPSAATRALWAPNERRIMPSKRVLDHAANLAIAGCNDGRAVGSAAPRGGALCPVCWQQASVQGNCGC